LRSVSLWRDRHTPTGRFMVCGPGYGVEGDSRSCPFAFTAGRVVNGQGARNPVILYSPVTGGIYQMEWGQTSVTTDGYTRPGLRRAGGNNAVVIPW
jgi:hypothetical protein